MSALVAFSAVAACTSSGHRHGGSVTPSGRRSGTPEASTASATPLPSGVVGATRLPTKVANKPELRADVSLASCAARPHGWRASGTIRNPRSAAHTYRVTVFFTTDKATVVGYAATSVRVPGNASKTWTAGATFRAPRPTLCVLRGVG